MSSRKLILLPTGIAINEDGNQVINTRTYTDDDGNARNSVNVNARLVLDGGDFDLQVLGGNDIIVGGGDLRVQGGDFIVSGAGDKTIQVGDPTGQDGFFSCVDTSRNKVFEVNASETVFHTPVRTLDRIDCMDSNDHHILQASSEQVYIAKPLMCVDGRDVPSFSVNNTETSMNKPVKVNTTLDVDQKVTFNGGDFTYDPETQTLTVTNLEVLGTFSNTSNSANRFVIEEPAEEDPNAQ